MPKHADLCVFSAFRRTTLSPAATPGPGRQDKGREVSRPSPSQRSTRPTRELPRSSLVKHTGRFSVIPGLRPRVAERRPPNGSAHRSPLPRVPGVVSVRPRARPTPTTSLSDSRALRHSRKSSPARGAILPAPRIEASGVGPDAPAPRVVSPDTVREFLRVDSRGSARAPILPTLPTLRLDGRGAMPRGMARERSGVGWELPASLARADSAPAP
ncbi:hypothetical protein B0H15DRAFT_24944 [Mycena belliarum]|uniref:Uncharacterized protein n=1 Tax=Mycena belliarum TaxID=1033014 RepID=A0AAD6XV16_9AGAR|nr:hypothetical protein B0H15DRAFT_24944 [Mycena belliae]